LLLWGHFVSQKLYFYLEIEMIVDSKFIAESATGLYQVEALLSEEDILQMANKISQHRFKKGEAFKTCRSG